MQEVEIDSNIKIIDSPGIIFQRPKNESPDEFFALKNAQHINTVQDPFPLAADILKRATVMYFCKLYDITEYRSPEEFLAKKAVKMGKLIRGGVPDVRSSARSLIHDWNVGKIKYCTQPPLEDLTDVHLGASIVTTATKELEIDNLAELEQNFMSELNEHYSFNEEFMEVETKGPVSMKSDKRNKDHKESYGDGDIIDDVEIKKADKKRKRKAGDDDTESKKAKEDPVFQIEGNQSLNKQNKASAKKLKKQRVKTDKKISNVADVLDNFSLGGGGGDYDFDDDYNVE